MATVSSLIAKVRLELGDEAKPFLVSFTGNGTNKQFDLSYSPVDAVSVVVKVNNTTVTSGFVLDDKNGIVTFTAAPANNATVVISGNHFRWFTDATVQSYVDTAVLQHTDGRTNAFGAALTLANLPDVEVYPVSILATIEALWTLATDASFDIDIHTPEGVSIPRSQRFHQILTLIEEKKMHYAELCKLLGIGMYGIQVMQLQKVSMKSGRYVPTYIPKEIDDYGLPVRIRIPHGSYGGNVPAEDTATYDIVTQQDSSWTADFDFPFNLNDVTLKAQIRLYPASVVVAEIAIQIIDAANGIARLSLTRAQTKKLPERAQWDLKAVGVTDPTWSDTFVRGYVYCSRQITTVP